MSRSSTPGSPAGHPAAPHGNRARSFDYPQSGELDDASLDPALAATPGHGGVGVFQAPRPPQRRAVPTEPGPVTPSTRDGADIDSPFLDLFGGAYARPGSAQRGNALPARAVPQQAAPAGPTPVTNRPAPPPVPAQP
ncbi:hypothetical protein C1I95_06335, partial [Micromonospora craterilacus]